MTMDTNNDELRRQLRDSQREHEEMMPTFRSVLARVFDPEGRGERINPDDKARLLGLPRRSLLGGGALAAGAAVLAACSEPTKKVQLAQTGTVPDPKATTTLDPRTAADEAQRLDLTLLRTAQSTEALAVAAYTLALSTNKLDQEVADAARLFQTQHRDHKGAIISQITTVGGEKYTNPDAGDPPAGISQSDWAEVNPYLWKATVAPVVADAGALTQDSIIKLATDLEDVAAQTYTKLGGVLSSPDLRGFIMSIGGIEARHVAVLLGVASPGDPRQQAPFPFEKTANAVPPEAYVGVGAVNKPAQITTTTARSTTTKPASTGSTTKAGGSGSTGSTTAGASAK